ncbi:MAG: HAD family hydrolase [Opitutae bacterium]|nr:HAD family hydrolase [Opitutae bacterium]
MNEVRTIVFDLDDTLYPERDYVLSGFAAVDAWLMEQKGIEGFGARAVAAFERGVRGRIFDEVWAELGEQAVPVSHLVEVYRKHTPQLRLPEPARELLDWCRCRYRLALVSDGYLAVQERKVAALGLTQWIECIVLSDQWGRDAWKPSERPFREVMARLPGEPESFLYLADNPRKDFVAPKRLGWRTVRFRRPRGEHANYEASPLEAAECEIADLSAMRDLLTRVSPST